MKYHPDSGPIRISSADQLGDMLGDEMRTLYAGVTRRKFVTVMSQRRKPVMFNDRVASTWLSTYGSTGIHKFRSSSSGSAVPYLCPLVPALRGLRGLVCV